MGSTKILAASCLAAIAMGLEAFGTVVHTPALPLRSFYEDKTNPCSDEGGGLWTLVGRKSIDAVVNGMPSEPKTANGAVGGMFAGGFPFVVVNDSESDISFANYLPNDQPNYLHPGEVFLHPAAGASSVLVPELVFTVPRTGRYSVTAHFRAFEASSTAGQVDVAVCLDAGVVVQKTLTHSYTELGELDFALSDRVLLAGQKISFSVGPGADGYFSDSTVLLVTITEEELPVEETWDFVSAFRAASAREQPPMPIPDSSGTGEWSLFSITDRRTPFLGDGFSKSMNSWRTGEAGMPYVRPSGDDSPYASCVAAGTSEAVDTKSDTKHPRLSLLEPDEFHAHPGNAASLNIRFTVPKAGRYALAYTLRDGSQSSSADSSSGVRIYALAGGSVVSEDRVCAETGDGVVIGFVEMPYLPAGSHVDLVIDNNGAYNNDNTMGRLNVFRLGEDVTESVRRIHSAGVSLAVNAAGDNANSFVDAQGAAWTVGKRSRSQDDFAPLPVAVSSTVLRGYRSGSASGSWSYDWYPQFHAYGQGDVDNAMDSTVPAEKTLGALEFLMHPGNNMMGADLRFQAPRDGLYSVRASGRDVEDAQNNGVELCLVVAGGHYVAPTGIAGLRVGWAYLACADLYAEALWLRAGETIDLCTYTETGRTTINGDRTALAETIWEAPPPEGVDVVAVDISAAGDRRKRTARGIVGFGDQVWRTTSLSDGALVAEGLHRSAKSRTTASFSLRHGGADPVSATTGFGSILDGGVVSSGTEDAYAFSLSGLPPNAEVVLYFYGVPASADGAAPKFDVNGSSAMPTRFWSYEEHLGSEGFRDVAVLTVGTDDSGSVSGTFSSSADGKSAVFCGLQAVSPTCDDFIGPGLTITIR